MIINIKVLLITAFSLFLVHISFAQPRRYSTFSYSIQDSTVVDISLLWLQDDRKPTLHNCDKANHYIKNNDQLKKCLENALGFKIYEVEIKTTSPLPYREGVCTKRSNPYRSKSVIYLNEDGEVTRVQNIHHNAKSIDTLVLQDIIKNTVWQPALKKLTPVKSVFVIDIKFDNAICQREYLVEAKLTLTQSLSKSINKLRRIILNNEMIWDVEEYNQIMKLRNENDWEHFITKIKSKFNSHLIQIEKDHLLSRINQNTSCDEFYKLNKLKGVSSSYIDELIKIGLSEL